MNENPTTMPMKKDTTPNANSFPPIRTTKVSSKSIPHRHHKPSSFFSYFSTFSYLFCFSTSSFFSYFSTFSHLFCFSNSSYFSYLSTSLIKTYQIPPYSPQGVTHNTYIHFQENPFSSLLTFSKKNWGFKFSIYAPPPLLPSPSALPYLSISKQRRSKG